MGAVTTIGVFVAIVIVLYGLSSLKDKAIGAANRKIQGAKHHEGVNYLTTEYFYPTEAAGELLVAALRDRVRTERSAPLAGARTYLTHSDKSQVSWANGNKMVTFFRAHALIVTAELEDGTEQPGVFFAKQDVLTALESVDPTVVETISSAQS